MSAANSNDATDSATDSATATPMSTNCPLRATALRRAIGKDKHPSLPPSAADPPSGLRSAECGAWHAPHPLQGMPDMASTSPSSAPLSALTGIHHVRLTVTDISRSKRFYTQLLGIEPAIDFTAEALDSGVRTDPHRFFGGCTYSFQGQLLGLRPVDKPNDRFDSSRVGLDHLSLAMPEIEDLHEAARRMSQLGIGHGDIVELPALGIAILSFQDPDDINLELVTTHNP